MTATPLLTNYPTFCQQFPTTLPTKKIQGQTAPRIFLLTKGGVICQQQKRRRPREQGSLRPPWEKKRSLAKRDGTNLRPLFHKNNAAKHIRRQGRYPASRRLHTPAPPQRAWSRKSCCRKSGADTQNITVRGRSRTQTTRCTSRSTAFDPHKPRKTPGRRFQPKTKTASRAAKPAPNRNILHIGAIFSTRWT